MGFGFLGIGAFNDPGVGPVLWRHDPVKERFVNNDAQLFPNGLGIYHLVILRILTGFWP